MSKHMWQRAALKKYSLALYLSNELSIASAATYKLQPNWMSKARNITKLLLLLYIAVTICFISG